MASALLFIVGAAKGDTDIRRTSQLSLGQPTEIPGMILEPGTYTVKVLDFTNGKVQVQFSNENDSKVIATVIARRARRSNLEDGQTGFTYFQPAADAPQALKTWYYVGDEWGEEFVYTKHITLATKDNVQITQTAQVTTPPKETYTPPPAPAPEPAPVAEVSAPAPAPAARNLPKTASDLPLLGLVGLLSLGGAAALYIARRS
jgi:LPXTG-motif cell wall-anchored protein